MAGQPVISVRGEATLEARPEIATVTVTVQARDSSRKVVLDRLARRSQFVRDQINEFGEAIEKVESEPASVYPDVDHKRRSESTVSYEGQTGIVVTIRDLTVTGDLMIAVADDMVGVAGPWWGLRHDSPVYREVRLAAARDAMLRAREYAEAFGSRITGLVEAADSGLLAGSGDRFPHQVGTTRLLSMESSEATGLSLEPARQTVRAQVEARFTMTQPEFPAL
jgi:uncharacterized protein